MDTKHTPGPWFVRERNPEDNSIAIDAEKHYAIARVAPKPFYKPNEQEWNARLIAAAPDLLDALRAAESWLSSSTDYAVTHSGTYNVLCAKILDAIAKAEGKDVEL